MFIHMKLAFVYKRSLALLPELVSHALHTETFTNQHEITMLSIRQLLKRGGGDSTGHWGLHSRAQTFAGTDRQSLNTSAPEFNTL